MFAHAENNRVHKAVYQKYKSLAPKTDPAARGSINPFTKNKAVKKHATEIEAYKSAQQHFEAVMNGRTKLPIADWQKEQKEISSKR